MEVECNDYQLYDNKANGTDISSTIPGFHGFITLCHGTVTGYPGHE
jgi:hypothetical protein